MSASGFQHDYPFDPSHGYSAEALRSITPPEEPPGFASYWQERYRRALEVDPQPVVAEKVQSNPAWKISEVNFASTDGVNVGGWFVVPQEGPVVRGIVVGHGYGGRQGPEPRSEIAQTAWLFPCARGFDRSRMEGVPGEAYGHVVHGIEDRDRYIIGACVEDLWVAVSALTHLAPQTVGRIGYMGSSFGGGLGALAMPWDRRVGRVFLEVPTFGHQPLRLKLPGVGSADAVRQHVQQHGEQAVSALRYHDAAIAARHFRVPVLVAPALFDPAVQPAGQFAVHNAVPEAWRSSHVLRAGHFEHAGLAAQQEELSRAVAAFMGAL